VWPRMAGASAEGKGACRECSRTYSIDSGGVERLVDGVGKPREPERGGGVGDGGGGGGLKEEEE